jgi:hypothetical protein
MRGVALTAIMHSHAGGGRIIELTSKVDTVRVLTEVGVAAPSRATSQRCLRRIVERDHRDTVSRACCTPTPPAGVPRPWIAGVFTGSRQPRASP